MTALRDQIDLPPGVAVWVLGAHLFTLSMPIVLLATLWSRAGDLERVLARPSVLAVGAALLLAGSVFEVAQNTEDRWFYTGPYPAFSDLLFTVGITAGLGCVAAGAIDEWWATAGAVVAAAVAVVLYSLGQPGFPGMGIAGVTAAVALWSATDHPGVVLLLVATGFANAVLLALVERTHAQSLHGAIASSNGLGNLVIVWVLRDAASGVTPGWAGVLVTAAVVVIGFGVAWGPLSRLSATPRPSSTRRAATQPTV